MTLLDPDLELSYGVPALIRSIGVVILALLAATALSAIAHLVGFE